MSLVDPRDGIVRYIPSLKITVINYSSRASELGGIVNSVYRRQSSLSRFERPVHLSPAKLITRFDDRYAVAKFPKLGVRGKVFKGTR